jgi:hypothetical protein
MNHNRRFDMKVMPCPKSNYVNVIILNPFDLHAFLKTILFQQFCYSFYFYALSIPQNSA